MKDDVILLMEDKTIKTVEASKLLRKTKGVKIALLQTGTETPIYLAMYVKDIPKEFTPCDVGYTISVMNTQAYDFDECLVNAADAKHVVLHCNTFVDYIRFIASACKIGEVREFIRCNARIKSEWNVLPYLTDIEIKINDKIKMFDGESGKGKDFLAYFSKIQGWNKKCLENILEAWYNPEIRGYTNLALNLADKTWKYNCSFNTYDTKKHKVVECVDKNYATGMYCYSSYGYTFISYDEWKTLNDIGEGDLQTYVYIIKGDDDSYETTEPISVNDIEKHPEFFFVTDEYRVWIKNSIELINYLASIQMIMNAIRLTHDIAGDESSGYKVAITSTFMLCTELQKEEHQRLYDEGCVDDLRVPYSNRYVYYSTTLYNDERSFDDRPDNITECCQVIKKRLK